MMKKITLKKPLLSIDGEVIGTVVEIDITFDEEKQKPKVWSVS